jgi:spore maturation protein CgeB
MVIQNSRWGEITRRIFEGMACKKLVLTDRLNESKKLDELFEEGKEIVFYDDLEDCINKLNYYHENEEERNEISNNGYNKVVHNYTQVQVVDKLLEKFEEWKNSQ